MKTVSLSGSQRENVGKKDAASLRRNNRIPAVLYGSDEQIHFSVNVIEFDKLIYTPDVYRIELEVAGKVYPCVIQDIQFHPVTDKALHIDLLQLFDDKEVKVALPVRTRGVSVGVKNGGRLAMNYRKLVLKGLPSAIPENIELDITNLKIGDVIRAGKINLPGCKIMQSDSAVIVSVKTTRAAMSAASESEEGEEEAAPEAAPAE